MFLLSNVLPIPLKEQDTSKSEVWEQQLNIDTSHRYLISAASGKGKTTFQLMLYGIRKDYDGEVSVFVGGGHKNIKLLSLDDWAALRQNELSIVFQDLRLFPELTAWENLLLKNRLTQHKTEAEILAMAEQLDVAQFKDRKAGILSYGQRQRFAIIRSLCQPYSMLLMDEPFSHLDQENIKRCCALIREECDRQEAGFILASLGDTYSLEYDQTLLL